MHDTGLHSRPRVDKITATKGKPMKRMVSILVLSFATALSAQQSAPPAGPQPAAPQQLKNVRLLKGMSRSQLVRTMQFMSASLGVTCDFCHVFKPDGEGNFPSDDKEEKRTARDMIRLVINSNARFFHDRPVVSCNTCHRGSTRPVGTPVLPVALPQPKPEPQEEQASEKKPAMPSRDEIVATYAKALGTIDEKALSSMEMKGVRETSRGSAPFDVIMAPGKVRVTATTPEGEIVNVVSGSSGWMRDGRGTRLMQPPQVETATQILAAYRPTLPGEIPAGAKVTGKDRIGNKEAWVLTTPFGIHGRQRLYFDMQSGLLLRRLTLTPTPVGNIPQQTDFDDYRDVGGIELPFVVRVDTIDPRGGATRRYSEIRLNADVDDKIFEQPELRR